jgi:hypothetical protein
LDGEDPHLWPIAIVVRTCCLLPTNGPPYLPHLSAQRETYVFKPKPHRRRAKGQYRFHIEEGGCRNPMLVVDIVGSVYGMLDGFWDVGEAAVGAHLSGSTQSPRTFVEGGRRAEYGLLHLAKGVSLTYPRWPPYPSTIHISKGVCLPPSPSVPGQYSGLDPRLRWFTSKQGPQGLSPLTIALNLAVVT